MPLYCLPAPLTAAIVASFNEALGFWMQYCGIFDTVMFELLP